MARPTSNQINRAINHMTYNTPRKKIGTGRMIDYGEHDGSEPRRQRSGAIGISAGVVARGRGSGGNSGGNYGNNDDDRVSIRESSWQASNEPMPGLRETALARPDLEKYDPFNAPKWNRREIAANAQEIAGPSIRKLREATNMAMITGGSQNPNVTRMTYREALQGYGAGLGNVLSGSRSAALGEYSQKYGKDFEAAKISHESSQSSKAERNLQKTRGAELEYRTQSDNAMKTYTNLFDAWKKRGTSVTKSYTQQA